MRGRIFVLGMTLLWAAAASAQNPDPVHAPIYGDMYCSGLVTSESIPNDTILITGEGSNYKMSFQDGDYVYVNKGADQGVKVGDRFLVVRAISESLRQPWFKSQFSIMRAIGTLWQDEGSLRVVVTQPSVSIAQVENSCSLMYRGDIVLPFTERAAPPLKPEDKFDRFAPPSGRSLAMVVAGKSFHDDSGMGDIVYVNLGSSQGVKVGDYFRIFRYAGTQAETAYQTRRFAFAAYGFGSVPEKYKWDNVPREVVGEGIALRVAPNSSTVLITYSLREIWSGDYVELE